MNRPDSLILKENGEIEYIGENFFRYLNLKKDRIFAYPQDSLKKGDVILYIDRNCRKLSEKEREYFKKIGIEIAICDMGLFCVWIYDNNEIQPISKNINFSKAIGEILLDTYFGGAEIKILYCKDTEVLQINLDGQKIDSYIEPESSKLFCFNEFGIKYFTQRGENRVGNLLQVIEGKTYAAYSKEDIGRDTVIGDVFMEEFCKLLMKVEKEYQINNNQIPMIATCKGETFCMLYETFRLTKDVYQHYRLTRKNELLENMRWETEQYRWIAKEENTYSNSTMASSFRLWGNDDNVKKIRALLQKSCGTSISILLTGESGTGKTVLAREIHKNSKRNNAPFVHVNCAAIPYNLIESELFGYEEGSFTGAKKGGRKGYFERAQGGTVFLDEITELPLSLQGKLLEVIQNKTFYRVGGTEKINIDVRLIAATNRNLKEQVAKKEFREDLYYRINVFPIELPPIRQRRDALPEIVNDILPEICNHIEIEPLTVSGGAMEKMESYAWPGNIRELENVLSKAAIMCDGKMIMPENIEFQEEIFDGENNVVIEGTLKEQREFYEKQIIQNALKKCRGERGKTAEYLGIGRTNLFEKMRKYRLEGEWEGEQ